MYANRSSQLYDENEGVELPISYEVDERNREYELQQVNVDERPPVVDEEVQEPEPEDEEEEDESAPFPIPGNNNTLDRTSLSIGKKDHWKQVKERYVTEKQTSTSSNWRNLLNGTKKFLGIDEQTQSAMAKNQTAKNSPIYQTKALNNWNERMFRVIQNNSIFGGKIKDDSVNKYIQCLNEDTAEPTNVFMFHRETNGQPLDLSKRDGVVDVTLKAFKLKKKESTKRELSKEPSIQRTEAPAQFSLRSRNVNMNEPDEAGQDDEVNEKGPCDAFTHAFSGTRVLGMGFWGRLCDNNLDPNKKSEYWDLIQKVKQHRPYFTCWVTTVQIIICLVSLFAYGIAPFGFSITTRRVLVTGINLEKQLISYPVKQNFWFGPAAIDLVHLGAKYAPCMRNDTNIYGAIVRDMERERESACCIRNDRGGCVQTSEEKCSQLFSRFHKWNQSEDDPAQPNGQRRGSGSVCGLDPQYCNDMESYKWPDDITQWPICEKPSNVFNVTTPKNEHMYCEIIGRPCCIGLQGECIITTNEHCQQMRGYFHEDAHLCSQVDCMQDVCGMIDFLYTKNPDQVYRLFTSIFIHAGILQLLYSIVFQVFVMRDIEKLAGCLRIAIIYIGSGMIGNLGSAIFLPYQAEVGPMGSQSGIIACIFVEMFHARKLYENPYYSFFKLFLLLVLALIVGLSPMIDNFANIFGFFTGMLLCTILFPNASLNGKCKRILMITISVAILVLLIGTLIVLFYVQPIESCPFCKLFSCPFDDKYCLNMDFNVTRIG